MDWKAEVLISVNRSVKITWSGEKMSAITRTNYNFTIIAFSLTIFTSHLFIESFMNLGLTFMY